jgi:GNAT superfamily N-acetyltransferase
MVFFCQSGGMDFRIRPIVGGEWRLWRSLRLRAVEESPDSFRGTLAEESAEADEWWSDLVLVTAEHPRGLLLVAEGGLDPIGMLFGRLDADVGAALLEAALEWAREAGAQRSELWVTVGNEAAERLYAAAGYTPTDETEPLREGSEVTVVKLSASL